MISGMLHVTPQLKATERFITRQNSHGLKRKTFEDVDLPAAKRYLDEAQAFRNYHLATFDGGKRKAFEAEQVTHKLNEDNFNRLFKDLKKPFPSIYEQRLSEIGVEAILPDEPKIAEPISEALLMIAKKYDLKGLKVICDEKGDKLVKLDDPEAQGVAYGKNCVIIKKDIRKTPEIIKKAESHLAEAIKRKKEATDPDTKENYSTIIAGLKRDIRLFGENPDVYYLTTVHEVGHALHKRISPEKFESLTYNKVLNHHLRDLDAQIEAKSKYNDYEAGLLRDTRLMVDQMVNDNEFNVFDTEITANSAGKGNHITSEATKNPFEYAAEAFAYKFARGKSLLKEDEEFSALLGLPL